MRSRERQPLALLFQQGTRKGTLKIRRLILCDPLVYLLQTEGSFGIAIVFIGVDVENVLARA